MISSFHNTTLIIRDQLRYNYMYLVMHPRMLMQLWFMFALTMLKGQFQWYWLPPKQKLHLSFNYQCCILNCYGLDFSQIDQYHQILYPKSFLWIDSMNVIYWIRNNKIWKQYVQHRVDEIRQLTARTGWWCCCLSIMNFADLPSYCLTASELTNSDL